MTTANAPLENVGASTAAAMSPDSAVDLPIRSYEAESRPSKILDLMHEISTFHADRGIAFHPIVDALFLLLSKSLALTFYTACDTDSLRFRPFFTTFSELDLQDFTASYGAEGFENLGRTFIQIPAPKSRIGAPLFLSISAIIEARGQPKKLEIEPYGLHEPNFVAASIDARKSPGGLHGQTLDVWLIKRLFLELQSTADRECGASQVVIDILSRGLEQRIGTEHTALPQEIASWRAEEEEAWTRTRSELLEDHWRSILDEALPKVSPGESAGQNDAQVRATLRFLGVFRFALPGGKTRSGSYSYGAQLILSRSQREVVSDWLRHPTFRDTAICSSERKSAIFHNEFAGDGAQVLAALEAPLGANYRSISDTHFGSGFIDFAPEASFSDAERSGPSSGGNPGPAGEAEADRLRKLAETLILDERGSRVFYVPIHVGGVPWIGLLMMDDRGSSSDDVDELTWMERYQLYRGIVTIIGQRLRVSAHRAYISALGRALVHQLQTGLSTNVSAAINDAWAKISAFFPYDTIALTEATPNSQNALRFPNGEAMQLRASRNPHECFSLSRLEFDGFQLSALQQHLETVIQTVVAEQLKRLALQEGAWAHDVKHWTGPILPDLYFALRDIERDNPARKRVERARLHTRILNATALVRQQSMARRTFLRGRGPHHATSQLIFENKSDAQINEIISCVLDLLLAIHSDSPAIADQYSLSWSRKRPVDEILLDLAAANNGSLNAPVDDGAAVQGEPIDVLDELSVVWLISFLREIVHNIKINKPARVSKCELGNIEVDYDITVNADCATLVFTQSNYERDRWEQHFPRGLSLANALYGPQGANLGWINESPVIDQREIAMPDGQGGHSSVVHVIYTLKVDFFLGGADVCA